MSCFDRGHVIIDIVRQEVKLEFDIFTDDDNDEMEVKFELSPAEVTEFFKELDKRCKAVKGMEFDEYIREIKSHSYDILAKEVEEEVIKRYIRTSDVSCMFKICGPMILHDGVRMEIK